MRQRQAFQSTLVCVGAGASGALTAARLLEAAERLEQRVRVLVVDPVQCAGRGVAFSTPWREHLLNVRATDMSAYPEDPDHLLRWLADNDEPVDPAAFIPRRTYGRYLGDVLDRAARKAGTASFTRLKERAVDVEYDGDHCWVTVQSGTRCQADGVVLALGHLGVNVSWMPPALRTSPRFIADPWGQHGIAAVPAGDVLIVGTGLTMVDTVLALRGSRRRIHVVSRTGLMPRRHAAGPLPTMAVPDFPARPTLLDLRLGMQAQVARARREYGDWRPAVDSVRPLIQQLWRGLTATDQAMFLASDARLWDSLRHRVPPESADVVDAERVAGRLIEHTGRVVDANDRSGEAVAVTLTDGSQLVVSAIVNCTGPSIDPTTSEDPLVRSLLASGLARAGPLRLGLATDPDGRLRGADGTTAAPLWTLGSMRRGELWESTAMPEISVQAARLAVAMLQTPAKRPSGRSA